MWMIGRKKEQQILTDCLKSPRPEFLAIYGRRRVGKTYLIRQYFQDRFSFYSTGIAEGKTRDQLKVFHRALHEYGSDERTIPADWLEAFSRLRKVLEKPGVTRDASGKRIVFLDEVPWMDTARSDFRSALDYFWNSWGSVQDDLVFIVCGSATSWIINHLIDSRGGFYNRITRQIHLLPFTLGECEALCQANRLELSRMQLMEAYMIFGGIPYYLNLLNPRMSLAQNVQELCFQENGPLRYEYRRLFSSLFRNAERHTAIIRLGAQRQSGFTRKVLAENADIGNNDKLTNALADLEQCGFIRKYQNSAWKKQNHLYQIIDPFTLFSLNFMESGKVQSWTGYVGTGGYYAWRGNAFEILCLNHVPQIKEALGIRAVETREFAWRSKTSSPGVQIDLLIDRRDGLMNLCEMKCTDQAYVIDAAYERQLLEKINTFREESKTKKAVHLTMITSNGLAHNAYSGNVINEVTGDDLF